MHSQRHCLLLQPQHICGGWRRLPDSRQSSCCVDHSLVWHIYDCRVCVRVGFVTAAAAAKFDLDSTSAKSFGCSSIAIFFRFLRCATLVADKGAGVAARVGGPSGGWPQVEEPPACSRRRNRFGGSTCYQRQLRSANRISGKGNFVRERATRSRLSVSCQLSQLPKLWRQLIRVRCRYGLE